MPPTVSFALSCSIALAAFMSAGCDRDPVSAPEPEQGSPSAPPSPEAELHPPAPAQAEEGSPSAPPSSEVEPAERELLFPEPIALTARLVPCRVELERRLLGDDDVTWQTSKMLARRLVRDWERQGRTHDWDAASAIAPIPLSLEQARGLPFARAQQIPGRQGPTVFLHFADSTFGYVFDEAGRTVEVDWDPVADSSVYRFEYTYDCPQPWDGAELPEWADDE